MRALRREYREQELRTFFAVCNDLERTLFITFLLTGFREQEVVYLFWSDINVGLCTIRVSSKPEHGFYPKRGEEREVPIPKHLAELLRKRLKRQRSPCVFPSPTGNRELHMLGFCNSVAKRAGLNSKKFNLNPLRPTYDTRMLRAGFDVRTVQHWMGHKSLETRMRYLVPVAEVHDRLDQVQMPGVQALNCAQACVQQATPKSPPSRNIVDAQGPGNATMRLIDETLQTVFNGDDAIIEFCALATACRAVDFRMPAPTC